MHRRHATPRKPRQINCQDCAATIMVTSGRQKRCAGCQRGLVRLRAQSPENQKKSSAQKIATAAIKAGTLVRQPCEKCGATRVHAHHDDYDEPLSVRWLCPTHHRWHHIYPPDCGFNQPCSSPPITGAAFRLWNGIRPDRDW